MVIPPADERVRPLRDGVCGHAEGSEGLIGRALPFADEAEQKMFAANVVVAHRPRGFLREGKGALRAFSASF